MKRLTSPPCPTAGERYERRPFAALSRGRWQVGTRRRTDADDLRRARPLGCWQRRRPEHALLSGGGKRGGRALIISTSAPDDAHPFSKWLDEPQDGVYRQESPALTAGGRSRSRC